MSISAIVRPATANDYGFVHKLIKEFAVFIGTPEKVMITAEQMQQDNDLFKCLVAEYDGEIVGFATYFFCFYSWTGKSLYLDDLYVVNEHRGRQLGTRFMEEIFKIARESNCKKVRWQVSNWNTKAIEFYKKQGASIDEVEINCDVVFEKN
ncbi:MAG: family N-acetyltransferase [Flavipsychrobacter sp.]|nr:family N-acetyltransferase [Flavipsychrobacter sp.]